MDSERNFTFNNGLKMPALGIGTWQAPDEEVEAALNLALEVGYRLIDTAPVYRNEKAIGKALKKCLDSGRLKREDIFITTKLPMFALKAEAVEATLRQSLADLQLDYVDLYLIHAPVAVVMENGQMKRDANGCVVVDKSTNLLEVWKKMEEMVALGLVRSIGVSNYNRKQVQNLLDNCKIRPANLQIEHHVYLQQPELIDFCKKEGIVVTAYAPLGSRGIAKLDAETGVKRTLPNLMDIPLVKELAVKHGKTPAQILIRWILDNGIATIPKSTNPERLKQNFDLFDFQLNAEELQQMKALDVNYRICDFKFFKGIEMHPEFPFDWDN